MCVRTWEQWIDQLFQAVETVNFILKTSIMIAFEFVVISSANRLFFRIMLNEIPNQIPN